MMPGVRFPAWLGRRKVANRRVWDASRESVRNYHKKTHQEDTAVRAVSPPSVYLLRSFSRTSRDASEEVSIFPRRFRYLTNREKHVALSAPRVSTCRPRGAGKGVGMKSVEDVVVGKIGATEIACIKKVVLLKGHGDCGKTTILKDVVRQLHEMYPNAWALNRRYNAHKFDITLVSEDRKSGDYVAVYRINGIVVLIYTGGDNPSIVVNTFVMAAKYKAQVVVSALKVRDEGESKTRAQLAYDMIERRGAFETTSVDIRGRSLRTIAEERVVAEQIVGIINALVGEG